MHEPSKPHSRSVFRVPAGISLSRLVYMFSHLPHMMLLLLPFFLCFQPLWDLIRYDNEGKGGRHAIMLSTSLGVGYENLDISLHTSDFIIRMHLPTGSPPYNPMRKGVFPERVGWIISLHLSLFLSFLNVILSSTVFSFNTSKLLSEL